jgi:hypothetical protein
MDKNRDSAETILHEMLEKAEEKAPPAIFMHRWFTTIIPSGAYNMPLVVNYCPNCRLVVNQLLENNYSYASAKRYEAVQQQLDLPREGCLSPKIPGV